MYFLLLKLLMQNLLTVKLDVGLSTDAVGVSNFCHYIEH